MPRGHGRGRERSRGDQNIAAGAVNESGGNRARRAGLPQGIKRQLRRFPKKVADRCKADIEHDPNQAGHRRNYKLMVRNRSALVTTRTELMLMAALAIIGLSSKPSAG
jgi:hypothetical protein